MDIKKTTSFWKVFLLSIITLSIYLWVYLFRSVRQIESAFNFSENEFHPRTARSALVWALILDIMTFVLGFVFSMSYVFSQAGQHAIRTGYAYSPPSWVGTGYLVSTIMTTCSWVLKWSFFFTLIKKVQSKTNIMPAVGNSTWILIGIYVAVSIFGHVIQPLAIFCTLISGAMAVAMIAIAVHEMNKIWIQFDLVETQQSQNVPTISDLENEKESD